jgi:hypothetical protein
MRWRWAMLFLVCYLAADFANPLMPGAVNFDANESVDGVRVERGRSEAPALVAIVPPSPSGVTVAVALEPREAYTARLPRGPRAHSIAVARSAPARRPASAARSDSPEDH